MIKLGAVSLLFCIATTAQDAQVRFKDLLEISNGAIPSPEEIRSTVSDGSKWQESLDVLRNQAKRSSWRAALVSLAVTANGEKEVLLTYAKLEERLLQSIPREHAVGAMVNSDLRSSADAIPIALGFLAQNKHYTHLAEQPFPSGQAISIQKKSSQLLEALALGRKRLPWSDVSIDCSLECRMAALNGLRIAETEEARQKLRRIAATADAVEVRNRAHTLAALADPQTAVSAH